ncbi:MAG: signal peptidase II, partial [Lachnospiraceae bacterium]|nr:signal peptidase II [Lachnospiraceae bacterium]
MSRETARYRETDTERGHREQVQKAFRLTLAAEAVLTALLVLLDQATKLAAVSALKDGGPFVLIPGVFQLQYLENRGAAFGLLQNARIFFLAVTLIALAAGGAVALMSMGSQLKEPMACTGVNVLQSETGGMRRFGGIYA